jgi:hypothetical protein
MDPEEGATRGTVGIFSATRNTDQNDLDFKWCRLVKHAKINVENYTHAAIRYRIISINGTTGGFYFRPTGYDNFKQPIHHDFILEPSGDKLDWTILTFNLKSLGFSEVGPARFYIYFPEADGSSMVVHIDWIMFYTVKDSQF